MFKLNFNIVLRNLKRYPVNTFINIGGIAVAITAFIVIMLYTQYENGFDVANPNYKNIYLVGRDLPNNVTNYTSPEFATKIREGCPEIELTGKVKYTSFEFAMWSANARIYVKNVLSVDYDAYRIMSFDVRGGVLKPKETGERRFLLSESDFKSLFPNNKNFNPEMVGVGNKAYGQNSTVDGAFKPDLHSTLVFDGLAVTDDIAAGMDSADNSYMTFIQVKPNTDIANLQHKINTIYKQLLSKDISDVGSAGNKENLIFLDPLSNLHLHPKAGTANNKKVVDVIMYLGFLVLLLGCINSVNMNIAQAIKRAKEIGVKKVMGASRQSLVLQFMLEIFIQCSIAGIIGLIAMEFLLPVLNNVLDVNLSLWTGNSNVFLIIALSLFIATIVSGLYPAIVLSSYKPALVLKGNFDNSLQSQWLKKALLIFQFSIAIAFITGLSIVGAQLNYMQTEDKGFSASQVVYIRNMAVFDKEDVFKPVKERILKMEGVQSVSVANSVPASPTPLSQLFSVDGKENYFSAVSVGFDYFETLDVKLAEGRFFSTQFVADTASSIILNEAAVKRYGILNPVGKVIRGCKTAYTIVGVIKDFKSEGFEKAVEPTVYTIRNSCGDAKIAILIKLDQNKVSGALSDLKSNWAEINKLDGEDFRYDFMDNLYSQLFKKQEQLKFIFSCLSAITILIALFGIYAYARFITNSRRKEIAVRKILGANNLQIMRLLNGHFTWMIVISNILAGAIVYVVASRWLENFAYKQDISVVPFIVTGLVTTTLIVVTVCFHAFRALKAKPVTILKYE